MWTAAVSAVEEHHRGRTLVAPSQSFPPPRAEYRPCSLLGYIPEQITIGTNVMGTFLKIFVAMVLALACVGWLADQRAAAKRPNVTPGLSLLPGDVKYESPNGNVRIYFPIVTSIVLSVVLTLILRLFS
jgi:hypothetical protein